ncbi:hypothetical protein Taro_047989, partial [Colocasia esculenta]|nr:hypothetical protein [Colocasia esculenta]
MMRDYWEGLCNKWATERWQETSTTMKVNQAANPEANKHTSGFVSFATHQSRLKYARDEEQPQLDPEVWVAASSAPKKGHVYGFGDNMDRSWVLSGASSSASQATSAFTTSGALGTSPNEMMGFIRDEISSLHGHGDDCDLWKLTEFNSDSLFELGTQIHFKQVPSSSGVGGDEDEDED